MKSSIFAILIFIVISCKNTETTNYALFSGVIKNSKSKTFLIIDQTEKKIKEISLSKEGFFLDTIYNASGYYSVSGKKESASMYLKNGYNIVLNVDAKQFDETITYTGKGHRINNYLAKKTASKKHDLPRELYSLNEDDFLAKISKKKDALEEDLERVKDENFITSERTDINYAYINLIINYERKHRYYTDNKKFKSSEDFPSDSIFNNLDIYNEKHFKSSNAYKKLIKDIFYNSLYNRIEKDSSISLEAATTTLIKKIKSDLIKNYVLSSLAFKKNPNARKEEFFNRKLPQESSSSNVPARDKKHPTFLNYENNTGGTTSLEDLKGKYVYIDFWATWCAPCIAEIPSLKKIKKQYAHKNIKFVSISIDTPKNHIKWKKMIADKNLSGVQLFAGADSKFIDDLGIEGIPYFVLIDPNGNIIKTNAPRPSSKKLIDLFNQLNI